MSDKITELTHQNLAKKTHEMLAAKAGIDAMTGLLNRRGWDEKVEEYSKLAERTGQKYSFLVADLDDLKKTNDSLGHEAGDRLIRKFSDALKEFGRSTDIIGRLGGDEFAICLPATDKEEAEVLKERLLTQAGGIKVSVGVGNNFKEADKKMYEMKTKNKNNV